MFKCIICYNDFEDKEKSEEHIFPESIGGTVTIYNVCTKCNSHLGGFVDSHLVNNWFIQSQRLFLKLPGKKGEIPNPLENGVLVDDPTQKIKYFIKNGIPESLYLLPNFKYGIDENGNRTLNIILDQSEENKIDEILKKMKERAAKKGEKVDFKLNKIVKGTHSQPTVTTELKFDLINWQRALIKIAYELVVRHYESEFINTRIAEKIRELLSKESITEDDLTNANLIGTVELINKNKGDFSIFEDSNSLYGILYNLNNKLFCEVRIFEIFHCILTMVEDYNGSIKEKDGIVIHIDVLNKQTNEMTLIEYITKTFPENRV